MDTKNRFGFALRPDALVQHQAGPAFFTLGRAFLGRLKDQHDRPRQVLTD